VSAGAAIDDDRPLLVIGNYNYSSWSLRAWFFLARSGVDFETLRLPLDTDEFRQRIGDYSPSRRVPVLLHGSRRIWDSLAICEYAAEHWPGLRGWPDETDARCFARSVSHEMHAGFEALRAELPLNCRARGRRVEIGVAARRDIDRVLGIWLEARGNYGGGGPWLCGRFGIVDAMYAPVALRFLTYGVPVSGAAAEWVETVAADAEMARWLAAAATEVEIVAADERG
jgi:glutathione S-transferase